MKLELCQPVSVVQAAEGEAPSRTIMGLAVPWNVTAYASTGPVRFLPGSIPTDGKAPKLIRNHDLADPIGIVTERIETEDGILFSARISETATGNEALTLAADGVLDAVSVGVDVLEHEYDGNVMVVKSSRWRELSMVTFGAFDEAVITTVAAEADSTELDSDTEPTEPTEPTENPSEKEDTEVSEATTQTAPIVVSAAPAYTKPRVTAAQYLTAMIAGQPLPEVRAADNLLVDIPGMLPEPLLGDLWTTQYSQRPLIDAVGTRALPAGGDVFNRRYIATHTSVAQQVNELDSLSSTALVVNKQLFTKKTFGGYVNISSQAGDWSEPALVQALVNDMIRQYARATETYVVSQMNLASTTATNTIASWTDGDDVIEALYDGAAEMFANTGAMPTHLIVHSDVWADLGQAKTATNDYIFPYLNPSNTAGQFNGAAVMSGNPLGLSLIVSNDVASGVGYLLYGPALEVYEDRSRTGGIRVENPATASATLGLWGYIAADIIGYAAPATSDYVLNLT